VVTGTADTYLLNNNQFRYSVAPGYALPVLLRAENANPPQTSGLRRFFLVLSAGVEKGPVAALEPTSVRRTALE